MFNNYINRVKERLHHFQNLKILRLWRISEMSQNEVKLELPQNELELELPQNKLELPQNEPELPQIELELIGK